MITNIRQFWDNFLGFRCEKISFCQNNHVKVHWFNYLFSHPEPFLKSMHMGAIFQKKRQRIVEKGQNI